VPLAIAFVGIIVLVTAIQGTYVQFFQLLNSDLTGTGTGAGITGAAPFVVWIGALLLIGLIGYIPGAQNISRALLALVFLVLVLGNGRSAFPNFAAAFKSPPTPQPAQDIQTTALGSLPVKIFGQGGQSSPATTAATVGAAGAM
jgi:hypothetical protein